MSNRKFMKLLPLYIIGGLFIVSLIFLLSYRRSDIYDSDHVFADYIDDTDYINENAPFVNANGRVYYAYKEAGYGGGLVRFNNLAYVDYDTGKAFTVCDNKQCIHNKINNTDNCELVTFNSDMRIDDEGYVYGTYDDPSNQLNGGRYNKYYVARYNLYSRAFEKLYITEQDTEAFNSTYSNGFVFVTPYKNYVYFFEYMFTDKTDSKSLEIHTFLRRYDINLNTTATLCETDIPYNINIYNDRIYTLTSKGLYSYDLRYNEDSRQSVFEYDNVFFNYGESYAYNIQFDKEMKEIYFIRRNLQSDLYTLCRVSMFDDGDSAIVDRRLKELPINGEVMYYQLCDRRVIFSLRSNRFIGNGSAYDFNDGWYDNPHYDDTDGNIYSFDYTQLNDDTIAPKKLWSQDGIYIRDWTVIGDYIYAEEYQLIKVEQKITGYITTYMPVHQVRISLLNGRVDILTPINYILEE